VSETIRLRKQKRIQRAPATLKVAGASWRCFVYLALGLRLVLVGPEAASVLSEQLTW
jgi:hypothetical protein